MSSQPKFIFNGYLDDQRALARQLQLPSQADIQAILLAAYRQWGMDLNCHVGGDYALILPLEPRQLFICRSAFSSHQLLFKSDDGLVADTCADTFNQQATLNPLAVSQLMRYGIIMPPTSLFGNVQQLASGESQLWHIDSPATRVSAHRLTLAEQLAVPTASQAALADELPPLDQALDFNALPELCRTLNQPIDAHWQLRFATQLAHFEADSFCSGAGPEFLQSPKATTAEVALKLLRPLNARCRNQMRQAAKQLRQDHLQQVEQWQHGAAPDFDRWFDLSYRLPAIWCQMRQIAEQQGKSIRFYYAHPAAVRELLECEPPSEHYHSPFAFDDASIRNPYDAMQRLMWHGENAVTKKLFTIVPPLSAGLLKQHPKHPEQVDSFCFQTLTLDHLARQYRWSVA